MGTKLLTYFLSQSSSTTIWFFPHPLDILCYSSYPIVKTIKDFEEWTSKRALSGICWRWTGMQEGEHNSAFVRYIPHIQWRTPVFGEFNALTLQVSRKMLPWVSRRPWGLARLRKARNSFPCLGPSGEFFFPDTLLRLCGVEATHPTCWGPCVNALQRL